MGEKRRYEQRERARTHRETRQRIVDALIELHETVGAAQTTVIEVARRAGVGRMTVYNHSPTEADMVAACTSHWITVHPPPDRDARLVESLGAIMHGTWFALLDHAVEVLAAGRAVRGQLRRRVHSALRLVVDFPTWSTLTGSGLGDRDAVAVAAAFVAASADADALVSSVGRHRW